MDREMKKFTSLFGAREWYREFSAIASIDAAS